MSFERIEEKIDKLNETMTEIKIVLSKNTVDIAHHIKRTDILQAQQDKMIKLLWLGAGIGISLYGPELIKILKVFV